MKNNKQKLLVEIQELSDKISHLKTVVSKMTDVLLEKVNALNAETMNKESVEECNNIKVQIEENMNELDIFEIKYYNKIKEFKKNGS